MHTRIKRLSDYSELVEMLFPSNRNQQKAAAAILYELKWEHYIAPNLKYIEDKYSISRRIMQRTRAKLSRLGLIEHISYLNSRYGGQSGWKLSSRFGTALKKLAVHIVKWTNQKESRQKQKDRMMIDLL